MRTSHGQLLAQHKGGGGGGAGGAAAICRLRCAPSRIVARPRALVKPASAGGKPARRGPLQAPHNAVHATIDPNYDVVDGNTPQPHDVDWRRGGGRTAWTGWTPYLTDLAARSGILFTTSLPAGVVAR